MPSSHLRIKTLIAALGISLLGSVGAMAQPIASSDAVSSATSAALVSIHPAVTLRQGDQVVGPLAFSQPMHVVLTLKLRNEQQLDSYIAKPGFKPLTSAQFNAQYAPTADQAQQVAAYLTKAGFTNVQIGANNAYVQADGHADTAQAAFGTSFVHVKTHDGRDAYANNTDVKIPANLQGIVHAVLGMQNVHTAHVFARYADPIIAHMNATKPQASGSAVGHNPTDFPVIYGASGLPNVTSVAIGSVSEGSMKNVQSDVKSYLSANGLPSVTLTLKGNTSGSDTSGDGEWDLDSQDIIAFTGVTQYYFYVAASLDDADLQTDYAQVVSDNIVKAIDVSLGECETDANSDGSAASNDTTFKEAVAQGQTFFVSAGDSGADECGNGGVTPSWPASSQYVTAVGGTELYTTGNTTWSSETVWNNLSENEGATGGSPSTFEPIPSWQKGVSGITNQTYRGVPDIAFNASPDSGALVTVDGEANQQIGGTSLAAPLAVGMWAHVLQANGTSLGFAAPVLYKVAQSSSANYSAAFHDITSGNNSGETAATGWDYTSGWGSVIVNQLSSLAGSGSSSGGDPVAGFTDSVSGLTVAFTNTSTDTGGTIDAYSWNFGDGSTATSASPSHTYAAAGTYTVSLTVTDNTGATSTKTGSVTVSSSAGGAPAASFTDSASGLTVAFTNTSTDTGGTIDAYAWNFGDGSTSTSASPSHTYASAGTYTVSLTVTDNTGATSTASNAVTVSSSGGGSGVFSNNTPVVINDNATITSNIAVTGEPGNAPSNLKVHVNITHNWSGDLEIVLYAPNGDYAVLQQPNYENNGNINKTFTVNASSVKGNGTWKLKVIDNDPEYYGDYGTLNSWSLTF
ncbi:MAG TPA: PKD domain-containing protein [Dyella sp.]|uniref:PKD domain-containing protein n=1 Tax=Dyella sp. TaxID=1869338 RepID=UPI002C71116C|nr:PKD domain-containing protein [Dyella sp.]HTV84936.1 PKD domain-containing protein [Dyella sp.]